jgi:hypothetical protein
MPAPVQRLYANVLTLLVLLVVAGCASGPPKPNVDFKDDYDFMSVQKIAFYARSGKVSGESPVLLSDIERNRIDRALQQALEKKGMMIVDDANQADLLVSWHLATQAKTDVRTYQTPSYGYGGYGGYGGYNSYARYSCWHCTPYQTDVRVTDYTEGTFVVDMIDQDLNQSVWRGVTQSRLKDQKDREHDQATYNEAADVIFQNFPPLGADHPPH